MNEEDKLPVEIFKRKVAFGRSSQYKMSTCAQCILKPT